MSADIDRDLTIADLGAQGRAATAATASVRSVGSIRAVVRAFLRAGSSRADCRRSARGGATAARQRIERVGRAARLRHLASPRRPPTSAGCADRAPIEDSSVARKLVALRAASRARAYRPPAASRSWPARPGRCSVANSRARSAGSGSPASARGDRQHAQHPHRGRERMELPVARGQGRGAMPGGLAALERPFGRGQVDRARAATARARSPRVTATPPSRDEQNWTSTPSRRAISSQITVAVSGGARHRRQPLAERGDRGILDRAPRAPMRRAPLEPSGQLADRSPRPPTAPATSPSSAGPGWSACRAGAGRRNYRPAPRRSPRPSPGRSPNQPAAITTGMQIDQVDRIGPDHMARPAARARSWQRRARAPRCPA